MPPLTRSVFGSFGELSLFSLASLTQTGDSIYFLSGRVYSLGYSLAQGLFGKEFHSSPSSAFPYVEVFMGVRPCLIIIAMIF